MQNKKFMLGIIVGVLLTSTVGYAAYKYQAKEVGYTPSDSNFDVDNVSDAISELYDKTNNCKEYYSKATYVAPKEGETHKGIVYLDPADLSKKCTEKEAASNVKENGRSTGIKTGCMKWYVYDDSGDNYTMMLDHNTETSQQWHSSNTNVTYENSLVKPYVDKLVSESGWKVTPRIITAEEINAITGYTSFNLTKDGSYCFGSGKVDLSGSPFCNSSTNNKYHWLFDYTSGCTRVGCKVEDNTTMGYWTKTTIGAAGSGLNVWSVYEYGTIGNLNAANFTGIRPVTSIPKNIIK